MKGSHRGTRLEAEFGVPRCEMGSIACDVEFDFVVCFQYFARFCVARKLNHKDELVLAE
jgi:hypothetical protein